jgi:hypothetical protein
VTAQLQLVNIIIIIIIIIIIKMAALRSSSRLIDDCWPIEMTQQPEDLYLQQHGEWVPQIPPPRALLNKQAGLLFVYGRAVQTTPATKTHRLRSQYKEVFSSSPQLLPWGASVFVWLHSSDLDVHKVPRGAICKRYTVSPAHERSLATRSIITSTLPVTDLVC